MKVHVAIVSDQTLANLIPVLMARPDMVYLACSDTMESRKLDRRLKTLLEKEGVGVETKYGAPDTALNSIHDYARSLKAEIQRSHPDAEIVLNATGGTKLMSLGFVEVFREVARNIVYSDTSHRRIEVFPDRSGAIAPPIGMSNVLDVPHYLAAQGFRYLRARSDDALWIKREDSRKATGNYLANRAQALQDFIGKLNWLADAALEKAAGTDFEVLGKPVQSFEPKPWGNWARALSEIARAGLIDWRQGELEIRFSAAESALFLRGGWLEEYAWRSVKDLGAHDVRCGVEVAGDDAPEACNEFDVLACHGNELLVIECKTLRYREENENQITYRIDSLGQQVRGFFGETWLLSAREPTAGLVDRARRARIRIIGPAELPALRTTVRDWMKLPVEREPLRSP